VLQRAFAGLGVRWFLFGAQAAILHGVARLSADIDVTVDLGGRSSAELVDILSEAGFELRITDVGGFVEATRVLPFVHRASRIPVDVVLAGPGLEEQFFAGAEERVVGDARVRRHDLDLDRIRTSLRLLEGVLDRRDLVSELERIVAAVQPTETPPLA
jgi:hypothetical protein